LQNWARGFVRSNPTDTLFLLKDLNAGVAQHILYQSREVEGTQSPNETLDRGWGSCRDIAVLFAEAARKLGFGARLVSGYLYDPNHDLAGSAEAGSPTRGQKFLYRVRARLDTFDPTNRSVGGGNLIPVAVARDISQCTPVSGSYCGNNNAFLSMEVAVSATS
jgi:transglutaminase-like putative cysteine protease